MRLNINLELKGDDAPSLISYYAADIADPNIHKPSSIAKLKNCLSMLLANILFYQTARIYYNRNKNFDISARSIYNSGLISGEYIRNSIDKGSGILWYGFIAPSEARYERRVSSYFRVSEELLSRLNDSNVYVSEHPNTVKCYLKNNNKRLKDYLIDDYPEIAQISDDLKRLSSRANSANWSYIPLDKFDSDKKIYIKDDQRQQLKVNLIRVYHDDFNSQGRIWGGIDMLNRAERSTLLVDGEETVEIDWSAAHISLLYHIAGKELVGDPYAIDGFDRELIKAITLRAMNNDSFHLAVGSIRKFYDKELSEFLNYEAAKEILNKFADKHAAIRGYLFNYKYSSQATLLESNLMFEAMMQCYKRGIDALSIHDGCRCRVQDEQSVRDIIDAACRKYSVKPLKLDIDDCSVDVIIEDDSYWLEQAL